MIVDLQFSPAVCGWDRLRDAVSAAEAAGFGTVWALDHLSGSAFGGDSMMECFTFLGATAVATTRIGLGSLVVNVANRHPGLLAVAAATVQDVSGGRFTLGLGAGTSPTSRYAAEQHALGVPIPPKLADRHRRVADALDLLDEMWATDRNERWAGFPTPVPPPPTLLGVSSRPLARLAGRRTNGVNVWGEHPDLEGILAAAEEARVGRDVPWTTSVWLTWRPELLDPDHAVRKRLGAQGVDRLILAWFVPPEPDALAELSRRGGAA